MSPGLRARRPRCQRFAAVIALTLVLAGCGSTATPTIAPSAAPVELGTRITYRVSAADGSAAAADLVEATRATLEARARALDSAATVDAVADGRLVLASNGAISPEARRAFLAGGAVVIAPLPVERYGTAVAPGPEALTSGDLLPSGLEPLLRAGDIDPSGVALVSAADGGPGITLRFTPAGADALAAWSADHVGDYLAIAVDNRVVSVPVLQSPITSGEMVIVTAGEDWPAADDLAVFRGALPAGLVVLEDSVERFPAP